MREKKSSQLMAKQRLCSNVVFFRAVHLNIIDGIGVEKERTAAVAWKVVLKARGIVGHGC